MGRTPREITDTELSLLNELWQRPWATVQELTEALYGNTPPALLATVRKLLDRLEAKGCVSRDRTRWPHHYRAAVKREFEGIKALHTEYQNALKKAYEAPVVKDPK